MNRYVHYGLTKKWALDVGYNESRAEEVAFQCHAFDKKWYFKGYSHFALLGAHIIAIFFLALALIFRKRKFLGYALHAKQDAIAHGWIFPWRHDRIKDIDLWEKASKDKQDKIEKATRRYLKRFNK